MKKIEIIKSKKNFTTIIKEGRKIKNDYYSIFYIISETNHYGISIPTKTGKASTRNRIKRQIKNIIDHNKNSIQTSYDYVIIIKKSIKELNYHQMKDSLMELFKKIGADNEKK